MPDYLCGWLSFSCKQSWGQRSVPCWRSLERCSQETKKLHGPSVWGEKLDKSLLWHFWGLCTLVKKAQTFELWTPNISAQEAGSPACWGKSIMQRESEPSGPTSLLTKTDCTIYLFFVLTLSDWNLMGLVYLWELCVHCSAVWFW